MQVTEENQKFNSYEFIDLQTIQRCNSNTYETQNPTGKIFYDFFNQNKFNMENICQQFSYQNKGQREQHEEGAESNQSPKQLSRIRSQFPHHTMYELGRTKEVKAMSYSEKIKSFFSNAAYNIKTLASGWKNVKINQKHPKARLLNQVFIFDEQYPDRANQQLITEYQKIMWFSYRNNFPLIRDIQNERLSASNDYGWGCTIRCSQMLLAEAIKRHYMRENGINLNDCSEEQQKNLFISVIKLFLDCTGCCELNNKSNQDNYEGDETDSQKTSDEEVNNIYSVFGIQNICNNAIIKQYQQNVKNWYTSIKVSVLFQEILEENQQQLETNTGLQIVNFFDQIIFLEDLQSSKESQSKSKSILVKIHMKFGVNKFEPQYMQQLIDLLEIPNFVGAVTGTETQGMYIVGYQEDRLIVLDPHFIQESTEGEQNIEKDFNTYFNNTPRSLAIECLSSDISLGYYIDINEQNAIEKFINHINEIKTKYSEPLLTVMNDREDMENINDDDIFEFPINQDCIENHSKKEDLNLEQSIKQQAQQSSKIQNQPEIKVIDGDLGELCLSKSDLYISNGSTLSDKQQEQSNLEKNNDEQSSNFVSNLLQKPSIYDNQLDNLMILNEQSNQHQTLLINKFSDFEVIS